MAYTSQMFNPTGTQSQLHPYCAAPKLLPSSLFLPFPRRPDCVCNSPRDKSHSGFLALTGDLWNNRDSKFWLQTITWATLIPCSWLHQLTWRCISLLFCHIRQNSPRISNSPLPGLAPGDLWLSSTRIVRLLPGLTNFSNPALSLCSFKILQ